MKKHKFYSKNLKFVLNEKPFTVVEISDRKNKKVFCRGGKISFTLRSPSHISDPSLVSEVDRVESSENDLKIFLKDETDGNRAELVITDSGHGLKFSSKVFSPEIIWLAEFKLTGFTSDNIVIPALGGQCLTDKMTPETTLSYKYPFWWNAQFVIGESGKDGFIMHTKDPGPDLKLLRVRRGLKDFQLSLGFEPQAPLTLREFSSDWYLDSYQKDWKNAVDEHRIWLEKAYELKTLEKNSFCPDWVKDINFVLEVWAMRKDQPEPHHTFDQIIDRINKFKKLHNPANTLLYIPGFAENGIDSHAPDYDPSIKCGGDEKFIQLMGTAHKLGYKVMLHTNVLAMTFNHPLFKEFHKYQVVDPFERKMGWAMDIDGDWLAEEYFAYMNPGFTQWGDHMEKVIGKLINHYKADSVFLDQTLLAFNVSSGPNFLVGMRNHVKRLQNAFPKTLFAGEGLNEQVLSALPMAQIHGIDSLTEVHGMEGKTRWKKVHPVSAFLFSKYTRFTAHLLTKYPKHPIFKLQEDAYSKLGVIPALCLYDYRQEMNIPEVKKMIHRAKKTESF